MTLADLARAIRLEPTRRLSDTPQARWNRENYDRTAAYKRAWRAKKREEGKCPT